VSRGTSMNARTCIVNSGYQGTRAS
jgi:hypothetical protein